jgi:hypothetical protein
MKAATEGGEMAARRARKTPSETPSGPVPMQPGRNGGRLRVGNPGNNGGRPSDAVRALALAGAKVAVPRLLAIVRDPNSEPGLVVAAADKLLKYGLGVPKQEIEHSGGVTIEQIIRAATGATEGD